AGAAAVDVGLAAVLLAVLAGVGWHARPVLARAARAVRREEAALPEGARGAGHPAAVDVALVAVAHAVRARAGRRQVRRDAAAVAPRVARLAGVARVARVARSRAPQIAPAPVGSHLRRRQVLAVDAAG